MCNRKSCNGVNTGHPWCSTCDSHTDEATSSLHNAVAHPPNQAWPKTPPPRPDGE